MFICADNNTNKRTTRKQQKRHCMEAACVLRINVSLTPNKIWPLTIQIMLVHLVQTINVETNDSDTSYGEPTNKKCGRA